MTKILIFKYTIIILLAIFVFEEWSLQNAMLNKTTTTTKQHTMCIKITTKRWGRRRRTRHIYMRWECTRRRVCGWDVVAIFYRCVVSLVIRCRTHSLQHANYFNTKSKQIQWKQKCKLLLKTSRIQQITIAIRSFV